MSARIKTNETPSPQAQELLGEVKKMIGKVPNIYATLAQSPAALNFFLTSSSALSQTKIPATLREQIALAVAGVNGCEYCAAAHTAIGKMKKIPEAELLQNLISRSEDPKTEAALLFVQQIVKLHGKVTDSDLQSIRTAGYSEEEIVEIIALVALNIFTNYFNLVAKTELDFPKLPTAMP